MVGLMVVIRYSSSYGPTMTSQFLKFDTTEQARVAGEELTRHYTHGGYSVSTKVVSGVAE